MEKELKRLYAERQQWEIERAKGILVRHILTDTIKMKVTDSPNKKKFMYPNYTKLIYKTLFGKNAERATTRVWCKRKRIHKRLPDIGATKGYRKYGNACFFP